jgi:hypothetical protein
MKEAVALWDRHPPSVAPAPGTSLRAFRSKRSDCRMNVLLWLHRAFGKRHQPLFLFPIACGPATIRRPDVAVASGPFKPTDWLLEAPLLTVDIVPPGYDQAALAHRLRDYAGAKTIQYSLMLDLNRPSALAYGRHSDVPMEVQGPEGAVELPGLGLPPLPMAAIYDRLDV